MNSDVRVSGSLGPVRGDRSRVRPNQYNWRRTYEMFRDEIYSSMLADWRMGRHRWSGDAWKACEADRPASTEGLARWGLSRIRTYAEREAERRTNRCINTQNEAWAKEQAFAA